MKGKLWELCFCGEEPVCAMCLFCERHCRCDKPKELQSPEPEPYRRGIGQGFGDGEDGEGEDQ